MIFAARGANMVRWLKDASSLGLRGVILITCGNVLLEMVILEARGAEMIRWTKNDDHQ